MLADVRSILFIELLGGLGDLLMALPAIHALASTYPEAQVDILTFPPGGEIVEAEPSLGEIYYATRGEAPKTVRDVLAARRYDLVVSDTCYEGIDALVEGCGARHVVPNIWKTARPDELIESLFLRNLAARGIIASQKIGNGSLLTLADDTAWAAAWRERSLLADRKTAIFNPHAGMQIKRWDADNFVGLGRALAGDGIEIVIVSGDNSSHARHIARQIGPAAVLLPKTTLRQLGALSATADLFLSVDTGPGRIPAAVGTPTIMLFGPTWAGRYGLPPPSVNVQSPFVCPHLNPMNFTEQPCWYSGICAFPNIRSCMDNIAPTTVYSLARRILRSEEE